MNKKIKPLTRKEVDIILNPDTSNKKARDIVKDHLKMPWLQMVKEYIKLHFREGMSAESAFHTTLFDYPWDDLISGLEISQVDEDDLCDIVDDVYWNEFSKILNQYEVRVVHKNNPTKTMDVIKRLS